MRAALVMRPGVEDSLFDAESRAILSRHFEIDDRAVGSVAELPAEVAANVEVLITGWGSGPIGGAELERMPRLGAIVHAAGTVKEHLTAEVWARDILVSTAADANAIPVAEFALAMILLAGKDAFWLSRTYSGDPASYAVRPRTIGNFGPTVGVIGASRIGRRLIRMLRGFDFSVLVSDPFARPDDIDLAGVELVGLDDLARRSDIVTIHAPALPSTRGLVDAHFLGLLQDGSTIINTARAQLIDQPALIRQLQTGRLRAVLDVADPEPLTAGHVLTTLPNVVLTPHLAGAEGNEVLRLGRSAVHEAVRFAEGQRLQHGVSASDLLVSA